MLSFEDIQKKLIYFCAVVLLFGFIIFGVKKDNHFFGLNESSDLIEKSGHKDLVKNNSEKLDWNKKKSLNL